MKGSEITKNTTFSSGDGDRVWHGDGEVPQADGTSVPYQSEAGFVNLFEGEQSVAEVFFVAYTRDDVASAASRPVTFVFNGGPGAASAFLHVGALGPRRVSFGDDGSLPRPPAVMVDNADSWLPFTDLVFIDPVGTGWSRILKDDRALPASPGKRDGPAETDKAAASKPSLGEDAFWSVKKDLSSLCETIRRLLSRFGRWASPVFLAGESYGGFRVARLVRQLQEEAGVGLSGAFLISPALDLSGLYGSDYNVFPWVDVFPTLARVAYHHGKAGRGATAEAFAARAESFAKTVMPSALGFSQSAGERRAFFEQLAELIGISVEVVARHGGRINFETFSKELLRAEGRIVGIYDGSMSALDPYPGRAPMSGADPSLAGIMRVFTGAIQQVLNDEMQIPLARDYLLLNMAAFKAWRNDEHEELQQGYLVATDHLKHGLYLNEHLRVFISHGLFDMVTPYFGSRRLAGLMAIPDDFAERVRFENYAGGHMYYSWRESRERFTQDARDFFASCLAD